MAVISREDKIQFVIQPYRELFALKSTSLLKKEIRFIAKNNGGFIQLFKQAQGGYEVVFSHDPGYLLGESIWQHFEKPDNLIYCEALKDGVSALLIIVSEGKLFFDAKLPLNQIQAELTPLLTIETAFDIYTYGNVPIAKEPSSKHLAFRPSQIKTFTKLEQAVFPNIAVDEALALLPLERAFQETLKTISFSMLGLITIVVILAFSISYIYLRSNEEQAQVKQVDPYLEFKTALSTPAPLIELKDLSQAIKMTSTIVGWVPTQINFSNNLVTFNMHSLGTPIAYLFAWAKKHQHTVKLSAKGTLLSINTHAYKRAVPTTISRSQQTSALLIDEMLRLLPGKSLEIEKITHKGIFTEVAISITMVNATPYVLDLIGRTMDNLPVKLNGVRLTMNNGLLSGKIQITVLGN